MMHHSTVALPGNPDMSQYNNFLGRFHVHANAGV
jgi:hypothetical protein